MKEVHVSLNMSVEDDFVNELGKIIDHKIDSLIDTESFPEIKSIYDCTMSTEVDYNIKLYNFIEQHARENGYVSVSNFFRHIDTCLCITKNHFTFPLRYIRKVLLNLNIEPNSEDFEEFFTLYTSSCKQPSKKFRAATIHDKILKEIINE